MYENAKIAVILCQNGKPLIIDGLTYPVRLTAILRDPAVSEELATILVQEPVHFQEAFVKVATIAIDGIVRIQSGAH